MNFHQRKRTKGMRNLGKQHHRPITIAPVCLSALLSLHTQLQLNKTQPPLQLQTSKIATKHFKTFSVVFWCSFLGTTISGLCTGEVALWHWWVSDCLVCSVLCLFSPVWSDQLCFMSPSSWLGIYKQHAAVVVSVRKNGEVEVCCVTNCDLHNWTATMCA